MISTRNLEQHQLLRHTSLSSNDDRSDSDTASEYELGSVGDGKVSQYLRLPTWTQIWTTRTRRRPGRSRSPLVPFSLPALRRRRRSIPLCAMQAIALLSWIVFSLVILCGIMFPSYTNPPQQYNSLRQQVQQSDTEGRGNVRNEKVFIAASLYDNDGQLLGGDWGVRLRELVSILGSENVFLSIYENNADDQAQHALQAYTETVACNKSIVHEHLDLSLLPHLQTPSGIFRLKRIAFLAEVRNRALRPLEDPESRAYTTRFDKILYLNDVYFDPVDATNLLFSTNLDVQSRTTDYRAACAVDFINPFKFYDTFATRDTEGYSMGVPFFPWFTASGNHTSRTDVVSQKDAVRVKSCWGGMVAFEAKWLQPRMHPSRIDPPSNTSSSRALRFRAEPDTYWDASECCLIHADLASLANDPTPKIYMNPYIRVAYSPAVLQWLPLTRRFERLYPWVHHLVNRLAARPGFNPRRTQEAGEQVVDKVWVWDERSQHVLQSLDENGLAVSDEAAKQQLNGSWQQVERTATAGQFCGMRGLQYIHEHPKEGEDNNWAKEGVP